MGLLTPHDPSYDPSVRQTGFNRYKQLISFYGGRWFQINLLTVLGALPLATGIILAVMSSSVLVLLPASILGGMIFGPFLAGLYDAIMRGLRDAPGKWWPAYKKSWKQNWKESLLPGALTGLFLGMFSFMTALFWWARIPPSRGTVALYLFAGFLFLLLSTLFWPQLVLFRQMAADRLRNIILFTSKYLWRVLGVVLLQALYWAIYILFAPWTLLLLPFLGFWYITFLVQLLLYDRLDRELHIEERFGDAADAE